MNQTKKRVLHILTGGKAFTGVSSYLYQYYKNMDRQKVQFDFLFCRENSMEIHMDDPIFSDSKFIPLKAISKGNSTDYHKLIKGVKRFLNESQYDIVIVNTSVIMVVMACLLALPAKNRPLFVAHAHNTDIIVKSTSKRAKIKSLFAFVDGICKKTVVKRADYLFACSEDAGRITFGDKAIKLDKFRVIRDAIDTERFVFDALIRLEVRNELNVCEDDIVYGNVGKLSYRKNQTFLLDVFRRLHEKNSNAKLWLIGEGPERENLEKKIRELSLENSVRLLGQRSDVNRLMQGMDCFVFTTISEGLGIVAIEAQASGLKTVVSDGVPKDVMISDLVIQLALSDGPEKWADQIADFQTEYDRADMSERITTSGYDIITEAHKFTNLLVQLEKNEKN